MDAEYVQKSHLAIRKELLQLPTVALGDISDPVASAFYPAATQLYSNAGIPFARCVDVVTHPIISQVQDDKFERLPSSFIDGSQQIHSVTPGDIIISKVGTPCYASLVTEYDRVALSRTVLGLKNIRRIDPRYLVVFLRSKYGFSQLMRERELTIQYQLTLDRVRRVQIFSASEKLQRMVSKLTHRYSDAMQTGLIAIGSAQVTLNQALGLENWSPPNPLSYTAPSESAFASGRLDAQYYQPKYSSIQEKLRSTGRSVKLGDVLSLNSRGRQPKYGDEGLSVINSRHVRVNRVELDEDNRFATPEAGSIIIQNGDVLINGTGVGTIGRAAPYLRETPALPDNHVTVLRVLSLDPVYLSVFLNSVPGQLQIEQLIKGSSGQIELYPDDIAKVSVWNAPKETQEKVRDQVLSAFAMEHKAQALLDTAKCAVEMAIEDSEKAALRFLKDVGE